MDNIDKNLLLNFVKKQPLEDLPKEILIALYNETKSELSKSKEKCEGLQEQMWGEEIYEEEKEDLKKQLNDMMDTANDLQATLHKEREDNESLRKKLNLKKKGDESSDEELEDGKRKAYTDFIAKCCQWNARRIKSRCMDTKKMHEVAAGSTEQLYKNFKEWAMVNELVVSKGKSKLLPSRDQFSRWCVEEHKRRYPMDWLQNGMAFPLSPNGSHQTPRVNLYLINDPSTGEKLYKHR